jgi:Carboxypeptidase regulatory-like domain
VWCMQQVIVGAVVGFGALVWGAGVVNARQAAPQAPPATAVILGQVVDADSGEPVADMIVQMAMRVAPAARGGGAGAVPGMAPGANQLRLLTGPDGKFVVRDVPVGNVQLSTSAPGYVNGGYGQTRPGGPVQPFVVTADARVAQLKIRVWRTATITGVVTDERGEPRPGMEVRVLRRSFQRGQPRLTMQNTGGMLGPMSTTSDDRGVYRISGLAPGDYVVVSPQTQVAMPAAVLENAMRGAASGDVQALMGAGMDFAMSGGAMLQTGVRMGDLMVGTQSGQLPVAQADGRLRVYTTRFYPSVDVPSLATVLTLRSGEERSGIDLALPLAPTVSVSGVVMGPLGPVGNVGVRIRQAGETLVQDQSVDVAAATTRADGTFVMPAVPTGNYVVRVMRSPRPTVPAAQMALMPAELKSLLGAMGEAGPLDAMTLYAEQALPLERDVAGLTLTMTTGATVAGRFEFDGAGAPPPVQGVQVGLSAISGDWTSGSMFPAAASAAGRVTPEGTFTTSGFPPGRYLITTTGRMPPGWFVKSALVNGRDAALEPFELESRDLTNVIITLTDRRSTISGTVSPSASGTGAESSVIIFPSAWREWIAAGMNMQLARLVRTPAAGTFSITGLPPREYLMIAVENIEAPDIQDPMVYEALARAAMTVTVGDGETRTVTLKKVQVQR